MIVFQSPWQLRWHYCSASTMMEPAEIANPEGYCLLKIEKIEAVHGCLRLAVQTGRLNPERRDQLKNKYCADSQASSHLGSGINTSVRCRQTKRDVETVSKLSLELLLYGLAWVQIWRTSSGFTAKNYTREEDLCWKHWVDHGKGGKLLLCPDIVHQCTTY